MEVFLQIPSHLRKRLIDALKARMIIAPYSLISVRSALGIKTGGEEIVAGLKDLNKMGFDAQSTAMWINSLEDAILRSPRPDLVWSGPEVPGLNARDTRRVYEELLGSAKRSIWASSYAFFDGQKAFEIVAKRMEEIKGLQVTLLLNIQRKKGDKTSSEGVVRKYTENFWSKDWPGSIRPAVYYDPRSLEIEGPTGVLHAKALVIDGEVAFVTSANLTEAALDRNIELGLVVRDRALAMSISTHFQALIDNKLLSRLPKS